jgi:hypothetical protein
VSRDHDVSILDLQLEKDLGAAFARSNPDVVGITAYTIHFNVA